MFSWLVHFPSFSIIFHHVPSIFHDFPSFSIMFHHCPSIFHPFSIIFHPCSMIFHDFPSIFYPFSIIFHPFSMIIHDFPSCSIIFHHFPSIFHHFPLDGKRLKHGKYLPKLHPSHERIVSHLLLRHIHTCSTVQEPFLMAQVQGKQHHSHKLAL